MPHAELSPVEDADSVTVAPIHTELHLLRVGLELRRYHTICPPHKAEVKDDKLLSTLDKLRVTTVPLSSWQSTSRFRIVFSLKKQLTPYLMPVLGGKPVPAHGSSACLATRVNVSSSEVLLQHNVTSVGLLATTDDHRKHGNVEQNNKEIKKLVYV
eukprot:837357-Amphidinium_carterae.1